MDESTKLILDMLQGGLSWDKTWLLSQLVMAMAIMVMLWRGTQLFIAGIELKINKRLQINTWLYVPTSTGQVRHKLLKKGWFRVYFYNYDNKSLVVKSNLVYVKETKDYMSSTPTDIQGTNDRSASDFGL